MSAETSKGVPPIRRKIASPANEMGVTELIESRKNHEESIADLENKLQEASTPEETEMLKKRISNLKSSKAKVTGAAVQKGNEKLLERVVQQTQLDRMTS